MYVTVSRNKQIKVMTSDTPTPDYRADTVLDKGTRVAVVSLADPHENKRLNGRVSFTRDEPLAYRSFSLEAR